MLRKVEVLRERGEDEPAPAVPLVATGQDYLLPPGPQPVTEMIPTAEFTDREEMLASLVGWFKRIAYCYSRSRALISPRRMGKTAVLDRSVNVMFRRDYNVVQFCIKKADGDDPVAVHASVFQGLLSAVYWLFIERPEFIPVRDKRWSAPGTRNR